MDKNELVNALPRRQFLRATSAAAFAALVGGEPQLRAGATKIPATADSVILLWMAGGMAQTETFDPKRYTPYETGLRSERVLSTFPAIPTAVDGVQHGPFEFAPLPAAHPLAARALAGIGTSPALLWARRSWYSLRGRRLLLQEVFLPELVPC